MAVASPGQSGFLVALRAIGSRGRGLLPLAAFAFFVLSLGFIAIFVQRNWQAVRNLPPLDTGGLAVAAVLYLLAHPFTSSGWVLGVRGLGQDLPFPAGLRIAFASQVGKYLPGNIAHYFARAGLAKSAGITLAGSSLATLLEIMAALLAAIIVAATANLVDPAPITAVSASLTHVKTWSGVLVAIAIIAAGLMVRRTGIPNKVLALMTACLAANFILAGLSFHAVVLSVSDQATTWVASVGIFTVAWAIGYLVPGAPAGLGVREVILVAWLTPIVGPGPAIACTVLHRLITAAVDALVGLFGYGWLRLGKPAQDLSKK